MGLSSTIVKSFVIFVTFVAMGFLIATILAPAFNYIFYQLFSAVAEMWGGVFPENLAFLQDTANTYTNFAAWVGKGMIILGAIMSGLYYYIQARLKYKQDIYY